MDIAEPMAVSAVVALLAEGVDRNRNVQRCAGADFLSPSSRRAWIEIVLHLMLHLALHVALLAEGVDRNFSSIRLIPLSEVALLAEGVDRNIQGPDTEEVLLSSPSSRRAWIEISPAAL